MKLIRLISVTSIKGENAGSFVCAIDADLGSGTDTMTYVLTPDDQQGLAPQVRRAVNEWRDASLPIGEIE